MPLRYIDSGKKTSVIVSNVDGSDERTANYGPINQNWTTYCRLGPDGKTVRSAVQGSDPASRSARVWQSMPVN
jgi:hypothetical protein